MSRIITYLDDMLLMGQSVQEILTTCNTVIYLLLHLGFAINQKKSVLSLVPNIEASGGFREYDMETDRGKSSNSLNLLQNNFLQPEDIHFRIIRSSLFHNTSSTSSSTAVSVFTTAAHLSPEKEYVIQQENKSG